MTRQSFYMKKLDTLGKLLILLLQPTSTMHFNSSLALWTPILTLCCSTRLQISFCKEVNSTEQWKCTPHRTIQKPWNYV